MGEGGSDGDDDDDDDCHYEAEEDEEDEVCGRGLEPYLPGEAKKRRQTRRTHRTQILGRYNNSESSSDDHEREEELRALASRQNSAGIRYSQSLALQDAMEAR